MIGGDNGHVDGVEHVIVPLLPPFTINPPYRPIPLPLSPATAKAALASSAPSVSGVSMSGYDRYREAMTGYSSLLFIRVPPNAPIAPAATPAAAPSMTAYDYVYKITHQGDRRVGKSSLVISPLIGIDFKMHTLQYQQHVIKTQHWDEPVHAICHLTPRHVIASRPHTYRPTYVLCCACVVLYDDNA